MSDTNASPLGRLLQIAGWLVDDLDRSELPCDDDKRRKDEDINIICHVGLLRGRQRGAVNETGRVVDEAKRELDALRELIESLEWAGTVMESPCCPNCRREPHEGHTPTCLIKEALKA